YGVVILRPPKPELIRHCVARLSVCLQNQLRIREPPCTALRTQFCGACLGMDVIRNAWPKTLRLKVLQLRPANWRHDQIGAFGVGPHPIEERAIPGDETVRDKALCVCLGLVPYILRVEWEREGQIADFEFARSQILQGNCPKQRMVLKTEGFLNLQ